MSTKRKKKSGVSEPTTRKRTRDGVATSVRRYHLVGAGEQRGRNCHAK